MLVKVDGRGFCFFPLLHLWNYLRNLFKHFKFRNKHFKRWSESFILVNLLTTIDFKIRNREGNNWVSAPVLSSRGGGAHIAVDLDVEHGGKGLCPESRGVELVHETVAQFRVLQVRWEPQRSKAMTHMVLPGVCVCRLCSREKDWVTCRGYITDWLQTKDTIVKLVIMKLD